MGSLCETSNTPIVSVVIETPLEDYFVAVCGKGTHQIQRIGQRNSTVISDFRAAVSNSSDLICVKVNDGENVPPDFDKSKKVLQKIVQWLLLYFKNPETLEVANAIEICVPNATEFQIHVWNTLRDKVPFGCTVTYGELAALVKKPNAARAVGSAMKKNPNAILVPCHRVIKSTMEIGNYNAVGGSEIKMWLLEHEKRLKD